MGPDQSTGTSDTPRHIESLPESRLQFMTALSKMGPWRLPPQMGQAKEECPRVPGHPPHSAQVHFQSAVQPVLQQQHPDSSVRPSRTILSAPRLPQKKNRQSELDDILLTFKPSTVTVEQLLERRKRADFQVKPKTALPKAEEMDAGNERSITRSKRRARWTDEEGEDEQGSPHNAKKIAAVVIVDDEEAPSTSGSVTQTFEVGEIYSCLFFNMARDDVGKDGPRLDLLSVEILSLILSYLTFFDRLNTRSVSRALLERLTHCDLLVSSERSRVDLNKFGGQFRMRIGSSKTLRYIGGAVPNPKHFGKIKANELRIVVQDCDDEVMNCYEEIAANCHFQLLHLSIFRGSARITDLINAHADKELQLVFQGCADVDLEMLRAIARPATIYLHKDMSIETDLLRELIRKGHTLELVRSQEMSMELVREVTEMLSVSGIDQLVSLDVPVENVRAEFKLARPLGGTGEEWICLEKVTDRLTEHRKWLRGVLRLTVSRQRVDEDDVYFVPATHVRVVVANCDKESIAGIYYPDPADEPETISEELSLAGARLVRKAKRFMYSLWMDDWNSF